MEKPRIRWTSKGWFRPVIYVCSWWDHGGKRACRFSTMLGPFLTARDAIDARLDVDGMGWSST